MAKRPLSQSETNKRRRARAAELRAKKLRRSEASKRGWEKRREREAIETAAKLTKKLAATEEKLAAAKAALETTRAELQRTENEARGLREVGRQVAEGKRQLKELFFRQETADERVTRMRALWRESSALISGRGISRYGQLLLWIQRNAFEQKEFWAEYRRRQR